MPRLPGRGSTRKTVDITKTPVAVSSFMMHHEEKYWRRVCVVEGCDHRMGPDTTKQGWLDWKSCDEKQIPAWISDDETLENLGLACPCHVTEILNLPYDA